MPPGPSAERGGGAAGRGGLAAAGPPADDPASLDGRAPARPRWWAVAVPLALAAAVQLVLSLRVGFFTGDDVEVLETALVPVGFAYRPWAIRNLLFPRLLVSPVLLLARAAGVADNLDLVRLAVLPFVVLTLCNALLVYRLALRLCDRRVATVAAGAFALHWLPLVYGGTVYPRTAGTTCILAAALLLAGGGRDLGRGCGAGALIALAFADRYSEAIYLAPLGAYVLVAGGAAAARLRRLAGLGLGFAGGVAVTSGLCDLWFWGKPFASLLAFGRFTLVETSETAGVAFQPALWYLQNAWQWLPPTLLPLLVAARRRAGLRLPWLMASLPVLLLSAIHHKELRYLQGVVPFLAILVAAGVVQLWRAGQAVRSGGQAWKIAARIGWTGRGRRVWVAALLGASLLLSLATAAAVVREKTVTAVDAALALRRRPSVSLVALSQPWCFGDRLFLADGVTVLPMTVPPLPRQVRAALGTADTLGIFAANLARVPSLAAAVAGAAPGQVQWFRSWWSEPVILLDRPGVSAGRRPGPGLRGGGSGRP